MVYEQHQQLLKRLSESLKLNDATLKAGYTCWTTLVFRTLKDGSLQINSLALNNCVSYRIVFLNGVNTPASIAIILEECMVRFKVSQLGTFCPYAIVYCYIEVTFAILNLKLFLIRVKELFEPIVL